MLDLMKEIASYIVALTTISGGIMYLLNKYMAKFDKRLNELDESICKNFLVRFLKDVERGVALDEVEKNRAHEIYDHYEGYLHKNSYIHDKWDKLMGEGE